MIDLQTAERLIESSRPKRGLLRGGRLILLGLGMLLGALWAKPDLLQGVRVPASVAAQLLLIVLVGGMLVNGRRQRRRTELMVRAFEAVQLRQWDQAREVLVPLLARPIRHAQARAECLLALAGVADAAQEYEVAQRICQAVVLEGAGDPLQLHTARLGLAASMLRTGQVADAVSLIDRLSRQELPGVLKAQVELLSLFREVTMGQSADALSRASARRGLFREHLGTRAAYGYALLAAAFDRAGQPAPAQSYWHDATLLIRPAELIRHFTEVTPLAQKYRPAEVPL